MRYNPQIHHRRSIRLKEYDYSRAGAYFITICCDKMECRFGKITVGAPLAGALGTETETDFPITAAPETGAPEYRAPARGAPTDAQMQLNQYGLVAYNEWIKLPERFSYVELDVFQIMPNHMHGILILNEQADSTNGDRATVGEIVGTYKSLVSTSCLKIYKNLNQGMGNLWQRNYYEHIIRNEKSYQKISNYIINNPYNWKEDKFYKGEE